MTFTAKLVQFLLMASYGKPAVRYITKVKTVNTNSKLLCQHKIAALDRLTGKFC